MERRVTPPRRVTSPTWGPPPQCKQALIRKASLSGIKRCVTRSHVTVQLITHSDLNEQQIGLQFWAGLFESRLT